MTGSVWTWLIGYLVVRFKGLEVERALNAASQAGIPLGRLNASPLILS